MIVIVMRPLTILSLVLLVTIAGCSAVPFGDPTPQKEPAPVKLVNNATLTETFTVAVVDEGANLTVTRRYGQTYKLRVGPGSATTKTSTDNKNVKVAFPESAHIHGNYTLKPGQSKLLSVEDVAPNEAIVILVHDDPEETYRAIKSLSCSGPVLGYEIVTQAEGEDQTLSIHECGTNFL